MMHASRVGLAALALCLSGCSTMPLGLASFESRVPGIQRFQLLEGDLAQELAFVRVVLFDRTQGYHTQALPATWNSASVRLHATDTTATLTTDRLATINRAGGFTGGTTSGVVFGTLRPGHYTFQVVLFSGSDGSGTSAAVQTLDLTLAGGTNTALTVTMKTTDGADATSGGTVLNTTVSDTTGFLRSNGTNYASVLGGPASTPILVAGDTVLLDPQLSDSTATGSSAVTAGGSSTSNTAGLDPGVLSRVLVTYVKASVTPTTALLDANETILTDWVRSGSEPIRGTTWAALADTTDSNTWPARGAETRTGSGTFSGTFNWNTTTGMFTSPAPFTDESALSENYRLIYRYFDNTYAHNLIRIHTLPLAVISPASIGLTVQ